MAKGLGEHCLVVVENHGSIILTMLLAGLIGSLTHCVGMCGSFALRLGADATSWRANLLRQTIYGGGRLFSYAVLGAAAGYGGRQLIHATSVVNVQAWLAVIAGGFLVWQGLQ